MSLQHPLLLFSDSECRNLTEMVQNPTICSTSFFVSCASSRLQILDCPERQQGFIAINSDVTQDCRPIYGEIGGRVVYYVNQKCEGNELAAGKLNTATGTNSNSSSPTYIDTSSSGGLLPGESKSPLPPLAIMGIAIAVTVFTILLTAIIIVFLKKRKLSRPQSHRLHRKPNFNASEADSLWKFPVIVRVDNFDLNDNPLDGYDPVDTTSHTILNVSDARPDGISRNATDDQPDIITEESIEPEEEIVILYKSLLNSASELVPSLSLSNPHHLKSNLDLYQQGLLVKSFIKAFNSTLETESRLSNLYKHIWYGSDQLDFSLEWSYCLEKVNSRLVELYGITMNDFVQTGKIFYEKYHMDKVKFIYTPGIESVDEKVHKVVGEGSGRYLSLVPGLTKDGKTILKEIICQI